MASVKALHIPLFIATEHPTCRALASAPSATNTLVIKQQVTGMVTEVRHLSTGLIQQLDPTFSSESGGQSHRLKPSNWLLGDP